MKVDFWTITIENILTAKLKHGCVTCFQWVPAQSERGTFSTSIVVTSTKFVETKKKLFSNMKTLFSKKQPTNQQSPAGI